MCDFTKNSNFNQINHQNKSFDSFIIFKLKICILLSFRNYSDLNSEGGENNIFLKLTIF